MAAKASPGRAATLRTMAWLTAKLDVSGSGGAATSRWKVGSPQDTNRSGGFLRTTLRRIFGSSPALARARSFSMTCSGACTTTEPAMSNPARPARPAIWWNSRADSVRTRCPSYFDSAVNTTVRIGTLIPTPERVGAADHLEEPGLGQALHQAAVLGQHPGVVDTDAVADVAGQRLAEPGGEPEPADELGDPVLLLPGADVDAHERLGPLDRRRLREVHDVDRRLGRGQEILDGLLQRGQPVGVRQRDGPGPRAHHRRRPAGPAGQVDLEAGDVAQRRRHEDELGPGQLQDRDLPRPAPVRDRSRSGTRP